MALIADFYIKLRFSAEKTEKCELIQENKEDFV